MVCALLLAASTASAAVPPGTGSIVGTLGDIATDRLDGQTAISTLVDDDKERLWALGMPHGLDRELLIEGGRISSGGFDRHRYVLAHPHDAAAAFLIHAKVTRWMELPVPDTVRTFAELEAFIGDAGAKVGYSGELPFVFRLRARARYLKWFVVGGMGNHAPAPRLSFERARVLGGLDDALIEAVGFYSRNHRGTATNPHSNMHIHFRTTEGSPFVAHLDDEIELDAGATVLLPAG